MGEALAEVLADVLPVGALRGRRESQEHLRPEMIEDRAWGAVGD